jgi:hypothetical protein
MLDQIVAPRMDTGNVPANQGEILGERKVERFLLRGARTGAQAARMVDGHQRGGPHPEAGADTEFPHVGREPGQVGKGLRIAGRPRTARTGAAGSPAGIDHAIGAVNVAGSEFGQERGVAAHRGGVEVVAVGVIPVVVPADWRGGQPGGRAKQAAKSFERHHRRFPLRACERNDGCRRDLPVARERGTAAVAKVEPE